MSIGDWTAVHQCNVYPVQTNGYAQPTVENMHQRYMHYFHRYQAHHRSLELEDRFPERLEQRMSETRAEEMLQGKRGELEKAIEVLRECRRTLKYTYPFAFFLELTPQVQVFQDNQTDLERATEQFSRTVQDELDTVDSLEPTLRIKMLYCKQRCRALLAHCTEGYRKGYWIGSDPF